MEVCTWMYQPIVLCAVNILGDAVELLWFDQSRDNILGRHRLGLLRLPETGAPELLTFGDGLKTSEPSVDSDMLCARVDFALLLISTEWIPPSAVRLLIPNEGFEVGTSTRDS